MKQLFDPEDIERKNILMLKILNESPDSLGARVISRKMQEHGVSLSERTVRYHLKLMDEKGLTKLIGRRDGRAITDLGLDEITNARVQDKISLSISRIDVLSFKTTFDLKKKRGLVPVNISLFPEDTFDKALLIMKPVFNKKLAVSKRVAVAQANGLSDSPILAVMDRISLSRKGSRPRRRIFSSPSSRTCRSMTGATVLTAGSVRSPAKTFSSSGPAGRSSVCVAPPRRKSTALSRLFSADREASIMPTAAATPTAMPMSWSALRLLRLTR